MKRTERCRRMTAFIRELLRKLGDERLRGEWLWLRAREKDDARSLELLAGGDPELPARMRSIDAELGAIADARERRQAYGRLLDERSPDVPAVVCACDACVVAAVS